MRTMLKVSIDVEAGNRALQEGTLSQIIGKVMDMIKPEASYFLAEAGKRTALFFFDLKDPSQILAISEPFFTQLNAKVDFVPAMDFNDLQKGFDAWDESRHITVG